MIRIGLDIMGGDFAPLATLDGAVKAMSRLSDDTQLHLIGDEDIINNHLEKYSPLSSEIKVIHAAEAIGMDESPVKALQQKSDCSLLVGYRKMVKGELDVLASAGHSGAVMIGALQTLKQIDGVLRPCVASAFPLPSGGVNILLDVGINVDCKPELLQQFARLGSIYSTTVYGVEKPRVALLNTGSEKGKGSLLYQKAYELLSSDKSITFVGNKESRDLFDGEADVTVADGFTGNIVLKQTEGFYNILQEKNIRDEYLDKLNYERYGGTPVLGVNGNVILGHGISSAEAINNMILASERVAQAQLAKHIRQAFLS